MNNKGRVFLAARKRGISVDTVREILSQLGAPPTNSQNPPKVRLVFGEYLKRPSRNQDISDDMARAIISAFINLPPNQGN